MISKNNKQELETRAVEEISLLEQVEALLKPLIDDGLASLKEDPDLILNLFKLISSEDDKTARISTGLLFSSLVEPLLDSFTPEGRALYYRIFSSLIQLARREPKGARVDRYLESLSLKNEDDLLQRKNLILAPRKSSLSLKRIKKVFILSRVTIGADIAVTSIIVEKAKLLFPQGKIFLIGSAKMGELFFDKERVEVIPVRYRTETFFSRLDSVVDIADEISCRMDDESIIFDPDSRFTQLGLLPLLRADIERERYFFYESTVNKADHPASFNEAINGWFDTRFKVTERSFGAISLSPEHLSWGEAFFYERGLEESFTVTANFGVGGNHSKRVGGGFERELLSLILNAGVHLLLDEGFGEEEGERVKKIREAFPDNPRLITFQAGIGEFASLIKRSSLYIGYDSMGQHVAAASSTPEIIIFKGYDTPLFPIRWTPVGKGSVDTILANEKSGEEILSLVEESLKRLRR